MHTTTIISSDLSRAIMLRSHHPRNKPRSKPVQRVSRKESEYGTKSYRDALQRAFNNAKQQIFFNPDMTHFITLTYKGVDHTPEDVMLHIKTLVKRESRRRGEPIKYIWIMEYQERGSIHVHMIANDSFTLQVNKNGYRELKYWQKGFSSVLTIKDFDGNFRPYLYLFKYMKKSQRIGKSFVHSSKNLNNFTKLTDSEINLLQWRTITQERTETTIQNTHFTFYKNYLQFDDTMTLQTNLGGLQLWHEQVKSHSMKELLKLAKSHSEHLKLKSEHSQS